ncbi:MAG: anaerobic ribonucleoside-triphosphate reductase activating protein [Oscillospiraceae bacterium]|nr:anaerobic ribonucleoside-triphosphate reductase activating protein [Oscillospiraceae bacterium]
MKIRIAGTANDSIVDGPGLRFTVFTQGCPHRCEGCHNPHTHDFNGGNETDTKDIIDKFLQNPLIDGITLSGGEPFCQAKACAELAREAKKHNLDVIAYTGFDFEYLLAKADDNNGYLELLQTVDYLIDGRFDINQRSLELRFKGSRNQRTIDVQSSLVENKAITFEFE